MRTKFCYCSCDLFLLVLLWLLIIERPILTVSCFAYSHSLPFPESPEDYGIPTTLTFTNGTDLTAFGCLDIFTKDDSELEGEHSFTLHLYNTSIVPDSLIAIENDSSTVIVTIDDDEGEVINVYISLAPFRILLNSFYFLEKKDCFDLFFLTLYLFFIH